MAKRISRRELKKEIKRLRTENERRGMEIMRQTEYKKVIEDKYNALFCRFADLGAYAQDLRLGDPIKAIEVKPVPFGAWAAVCDSADEIIKEAQHMLAENLVSGLIDGGYIRFTCGENDPVYGFTYVGAKLYVIPWERMVTDRVPARIYRSVKETLDT